MYAFSQTNVQICKNIYIYLKEEEEEKKVNIITWNVNVHMARHTSWTSRRETI